MNRNCWRMIMTDDKKIEEKQSFEEQAEQPKVDKKSKKINKKLKNKLDKLKKDDPNIYPIF